MADQELTEGQIYDFQASPVWLVIKSRVENEMAKSLNKRIDGDDSERDAGRYRAFELMLQFPALLLQEVLERNSPKPRRGILNFRAPS